MIKLYLVLLLIIFSFPSFAYIGPGMGGGVVAAVFGFIAAILLGLWAILYYPIKRALKNKRNKNIYKNKSDNELQ